MSDASSCRSPARRGCCADGVVGGCSFGDGALLLIAARARRSWRETEQHKPLAMERLRTNWRARSILLLSADFLMFKPICWKRAAVLHRYLSRNGIPTRIIFGVRNETGGKVDGHAWLEANGQPILESTPPEYVVTYSFP